MSKVENPYSSGDRSFKDGSKPSAVMKLKNSGNKNDSILSNFASHGNKIKNFGSLNSAREPISKNDMMDERHVKDL